MTNPIPTPPATSNLPPTTEHRSTGPRTAAGKQRSSLNALRHGLTAAFPVLPSEDPAAYQLHCRQFLDEYQPATPTESHLTQELADTAWRLNRIPLLEAELFSRDPDPQSLVSQLATLGLHGQRLSRQFQRTLDSLREVQTERRLQHERALKQAAALLELHKHKGIPYDPAEIFSQDGFVFSKDEIEAYAHRLMRLNESRHIEYVRFHMQPPVQRAAASSY
ncbi:MAG TPA: hypothetical protein VK724_11090 [Bryobacteraceae bacterium]|nr:hypothetical protein [Bryobacteraceae bacterium]